MAKVRRVDFSPDEWIAGTRELTMEERGAYWDVCSLQYSRGGPIADDDAWVSRTLGCHVRTWRIIKARLVAVGKLELRDGQLINGRVELEIRKAQGRIKQAGDAAAQSAQLRRERAEQGVKIGREAVEEDAKNGRAAVENDTQSNDFKDIDRAPASAADEANYQLPTTNPLESKKEITAAVPVTTGALAEGSPPPKPDPNGVRLEEGWRPEGELRQWTIDHIAEKQSGVSAGHELEKFRDHWKAQTGAKGRKADWAATWRNWIRKAIELEGKGNGSHRNGRTQRRNDPGEDAITAGIRESLARRHLLVGG